MFEKSSESLQSSSKNPPAPDAYPVLIVEDEPAIGRMLHRTLSSTGYVATLVATAEEALSRFRAIESPLLLVADVGLPGIDGLDMIEQALKIRDDFEVIVTSAHGEITALSRSVRLGVFRYLPKPLDLEELRQALSGAANRLFLRLDRRAHIEALERRNTELELALAQLKQSESRRMLSERLASIGQFAAALAHEINNPIAYAQTNVALLREGAPDLVHAIQTLTSGADWKGLAPDLSEGVARYVFELAGALEECDVGLKLMRQISADLSSVARYRTDRREIFDLNDVVRTACRVARVEPRLRSQLELDLASVPLPVRGSTGRMAQVVMNLVGNAGDAGDPGRPNRITVRTRLSKEITLEVSDTGVGISDEQLACIFEPFVSFREGGSGIGLGLVRQIVDECGGRIEAESQPGRGSTFRVRLPHATSESRHPPSAAPHALKNRLPQHIRLMVVDDDPLIRRVLARAFRESQLTLVTDGFQALEQLQYERPDALITDLQMPDLDGVALYEQIARRWPELARRVVFISGTDALMQAASSRAPGRPLLKKPFTLKELERTLLEVIA